VDATTVGSCAHHFQWLWTNLAPLEVLKSSYQLIPRSPTCLVDVILDPGQHSSIVQHDDLPPLAVINKVDLPRTSLPTLLNFLYSSLWVNYVGAKGNSSLTYMGSQIYGLWEGGF
jgi:hypothetical protein